MEKAGAMWSRRGSWTAIALVLVALALLQACGDSGKSTGPSSGPALQLKLRRASGAELPTGCGGVYSVSGPGVNINNKELPESGRISFQGTVGQTYFVSVQLTCGLALAAKQSLAETLSGSTQVTLQPGTNEATIVLQVSRVLGLRCTSPVAPNEVSRCACDVQSPGPASIGWKGATPTGGNTAQFSSPTPGTFPVTCTVNGVDVLSTSVRVEAPAGGTGTITVNNLAEGPYSEVDVTFSPGSISPVTNLAPGGQAVRSNVPPGHYIATVEYDNFECDFEMEFDLAANQNHVLNVSDTGCFLLKKKRR